jgi:NDP-sugar pyrophosphorylase family protein
MVKAFVLAAGRGRRLQPLTDQVPKPLLPVGNQPLIAYALRLLAHHQVTEVVINLHHLGKQIREFVGTGEEFGLRVIYSEEVELLGTGGGIKRMHTLSGASPEPFLVVNADTLIDIDLGALLALHNERGGIATLALRAAADSCDYGAIDIDADGRVRRMLGQPQVEGRLEERMFTGVHVIDPRLLDYIPPDVESCIVRYAYAKALHNDDPIYGFEHRGFWADAGTPAALLALNRQALDEQATLAYANPLAGFAHAPRRHTHKRAGGVEVIRLGEDVQLGADVRIVPPVLLCDRVKVGANAQVGPYCVVGRGAQIGKDAKLEGTLVLAGAKVDPGAHVRDVILGKKSAVQVTREGP